MTITRSICFTLDVKSHRFLEISLWVYQINNEKSDINNNLNKSTHDSVEERLVYILSIKGRGEIHFVSELKPE